MSTLKVNEVRHLSNSGTANIVLESNATTNLQATSTLGLTVTGTLTTSGIATFNGNVQIGNASTDTLTLTSKVSGNNNYSGFTGEIRMYAGNAAGDDPPDGWLYCNGDTIGQSSGNHTGTELQNLFNLLSDSALWGNSGSESWASATVKLPDFRSRSPVGIHTGAATSITAGLTSRTLSATAGTETHTLTVAQLAEHSHVMTNPLSSTGQTATATQVSHTHSMQSHTHGYAHTHGTPGSTTGTQSANHTHGFDTYKDWESGTYGTAWGNGGVHQVINTHTNSASHTHTVPSGTTTSQNTSTSGGPSTANTGNQSANTITVSLADPQHRHVSTAADTGSDTPHTILSPIIAVNYIIKV